MMLGKKLIFLISVDWFFCSHFLDRAIAAKAEGYEVVVITRVRRHGRMITEAGLKLIPLEFERRNLNPFNELLALWKIARLYRVEQPDLVHHVALKPILLGSLAARLVGVRSIINAPVGMGFVFSSTGFLATLLRPLLRFLIGLVLNPAGSRVIFENVDDQEALIASGVVRRNAVVLIRGAGINTQLFQPVLRANPVPVVMLVARMLWDKGVGEFVQAAQLLKQRQVMARFVLVGGPDVDNLARIQEKVLQKWHAQSDVEWWGHRDDMSAVLAQADIACLPSYREGLPKSLIEAMAMGLACVTTDVPGCREVVDDGDNGFLVSPRNAEALADALAKLIGDASLRERMGRRGRERAEREFSDERVIAETLDVYREITG
jgi:glycosyltransferase involved in cell wall biosynthesis